MGLTRRTFIKGGLATGVSVAFFSAEALASEPAPRCIVVLQMFGGNDTLNTFIPYADSRYRAARPTLAIPESALLPLDDRFAFHPALAPLLPLYRSRKFAFIPDLGFPTLDRSHFYCADVWHYGSETTSAEPGGWLGRFSDIYLSNPSPLRSIAVDTRIPTGISARLTTPTTIVDLPSFDVDTSESDAVERARFIASTRAVYQTSRTGEVEFVRGSGERMLGTIDLLRTLPPPSATASYPRNSDGSETSLAQALRIVAQTIAADVGTTIAWVTIDGFDTHSQQIGSFAPGGSVTGLHARLLANVSGSLAAFQGELEQRHVDQRVLLLGWSEFSRRLSENASLGTDHGKASTAFVLGSGVKGGTYYGSAPDLSKLDDGDLRTKTDFRAVYSTIIRDWFARDPSPILGREYENLGFIERGAGRTRAVRR